jgi:hypothetical protein
MARRIAARRRIMLDDDDDRGDIRRYRFRPRRRLVRVAQRLARRR